MVWREQAVMGSLSQPKYLSHMFKTKMFISICLCLCYIPQFIYGLVISIKDQTRGQNVGFRTTEADIFWMDISVVITHVNSVANSCII